MVEITVRIERVSGVHTHTATDFKQHGLVAFSQQFFVCKNQKKKNTN